MKKNRIIFGMLIAAMPLVVWAADQALAPGAYSAKVKALVCDACAPVVKETLSKQTGLEKVTVDEKTSTAQFTVKKDAHITLAQLQKVLGDVSGQMGMGADYTLHDMKRINDPKK